VTRQLFCYGTLMLSDIMQSVARCRQMPRPALLHDYACYRVRDAVYPGIVYKPGSIVFGVVYSGLNPQQLADTLFSVTPTIVGIQTLITLETMSKLSPNVIAKIGPLAQNAIQRKKDVDGLTVLDTGTSIGGAGTTLTPGHIAAATARAEYGAGVEPAKGELYFVGPGQTVADAARYMTERNVGAVCVLAGDRLVGILSERDMMKRVVAPNRDPATIKVSEVMTPNPVIVEAGESRDKCAQIMKRAGVRHLPVIDGDKLLGLLSLRDILQVNLSEKEEEVRQMQDYIHYVPPYKPGV